jgi:hypothetical protein
VFPVFDSSWEFVIKIPVVHVQISHLDDWEESLVFLVFDSSWEFVIKLVMFRSVTWMNGRSPLCFQSLILVGSL